MIIATVELEALRFSSLDCFFFSFLEKYIRCIRRGKQRSKRFRKKEKFIKSPPKKEKKKLEKKKSNLSPLEYFHYQLYASSPTAAQKLEISASTSMSRDNFISHLITGLQLG